ncbi:cysteine-rich motor neuron 1 protein-like isoform X1 [Branchiostoma floridae x Branchiostoma japonicum]
MERRIHLLVVYGNMGVRVLVLFALWSAGWPGLPRGVPLPGARAHSCLPCEPEECAVPVDCPGGTTMDVCDCCKVCARRVNETCGGLYGIQGTCDRGLRCVIPSPKHGEHITGNEVGVCQVEEETPCKEQMFTGCNMVEGTCVCERARACSNPFSFEDKPKCLLAISEMNADRPDCSKARCAIVFSPRCPDDSILIEGYTPAGECCPLASRCECNPSGCLERMCRPGYERVLVSKGKGEPGECCDKYECRPMLPVASEPEDCSSVVCPEFLLKCPPDSEPVPSDQPEDSCCPLPPSCECRAGICEETSQCEEGTVRRVIKKGEGKPGSCCDVFECVPANNSTCMHNGTEYSEGETFRPDPCHFCKCSGGLSFCFTAQCGDLQCQNYYVPDGECCPICEDPWPGPVTNLFCMTDSGELLAHGDHYKMDDCTFCTCSNGDLHCTATACAVHCFNPKKIPGECCPVCEEPTYITLPPPVCPDMENCTLACKHGYRSNIFGCPVCQCLTEEELCHGSLDNCDLHCPYGFKVNRQGCETCECKPAPKKCKSMEDCDKRCPYGYKINKHGCEMCRCNKCPEFVCEKHCTFGYVQNSKGCDICKCKDAPFLPPSFPIPADSCLSMDGQRYEDGEGWHDGCRECYCHGGQEMCALITCPAPSCKQPIIRAGQCCPTCPDDVDNASKPAANPTVCHSPGGEYFVEGETWQLDQCTQCTCHNGQVLCDTEACPPLLCQNPIRTDGSCCAVCPDDTGADMFPLPPDMSEPILCHGEEGEMFLHGESWKANVCTSCVCLHGNITCYSETCPPVRCKRPVLRKGQCCPQCLDASNAVTTCRYNGQTYREGEKWNIDQCTHCYCVGGHQMCSQRICMPQLCPEEEQITLPGECCPVCRSDLTTEVPNESRGSTRQKAQPTPAFTTTPLSPVHTTEMSNEIPDANKMGGIEAPSFPTLAVVLPIALIIIALALLFVVSIIIAKRRMGRVVFKSSTPPQPRRTAAGGLQDSSVVYVDHKNGVKVEVERRHWSDIEPTRVSGYYSMRDPGVQHV